MSDVKEDCGGDCGTCLRCKAREAEEERKTGDVICPVSYCGMRNCDVCHIHDEPLPCESCAAPVTAVKVEPLSEEEIAAWVERRDQFGSAGVGDAVWNARCLFTIDELRRQVADLEAHNVRALSEYGAQDVIVDCWSMVKQACEQIAEHESLLQACFDATGRDVTNGGCDMLPGFIADLKARALDEEAIDELVERLVGLGLLRSTHPASSRIREFIARRGAK